MMMALRSWAWLVVFHLWTAGGNCGYMLASWFTCPFLPQYLKMIRAACALGIGNAGRETAESLSLCLEGSLPSLPNSGAFAHLVATF